MITKPRYLPDIEIYHIKWLFVSKHYTKTRLARMYGVDTKTILNYIRLKL